MYGLSEESLTIVGVILIVVGVAMIGWGFESTTPPKPVRRLQTGLAGQPVSPVDQPKSAAPAAGNYVVY